MSNNYKENYKNMFTNDETMQNFLDSFAASVSKFEMLRKLKQAYILKYSKQVLNTVTT